MHIVNEGAGREVVVKGLRQKKLYVTSKTAGYDARGMVRVNNGEARFTLDGASFGTLMSE